MNSVSSNAVARRIVVKRVMSAQGTDLESSIKIFLDDISNLETNTYVGSAGLHTYNGHFTLSQILLPDSNYRSTMGTISLAGSVGTYYVCRESIGTSAPLYYIQRIDGGIEQLTLTIEHTGAAYNAIRSGKTVMVSVHDDTVAIGPNQRTMLLSGLPRPAGNMFPTGIIDWAGLSVLGNTEISQDGQLVVVGNSSTTSGQLITVDSVITYVCA